MGPRYAGLFVLLVAATGCARWQPQGLTPQAVIERDHPDQVRVTLGDSSRMELRAPVIRGDSIHGQAKDGAATAVALADVTYLSLNRGNKPAVAALSGVGVAAGLIVLLAATWD